MGGKLEQLYKKLTGEDPSQFEPPMCGHRLERLIAEARNGSHSATNQLDQFLAANTPTGVRIFETGVKAEEPYTVLVKTFIDGHRRFVFCFGRVLTPDEVDQVVKTIPDRDWFEAEFGESGQMV